MSKISTTEFLNVRNLFYEYTKEQNRMINSIRILTNDYRVPEFDTEDICSTENILKTLRLCNRYKERLLEYDSEFDEENAKKFSKKEDEKIELLKKLIMDYSWLEIDFSTWTHLYIVNNENGYKTRSEVYYE